jgi:hypothetical protein
MNNYFEVVVDISPNFGHPISQKEKDLISKYIWGDGILSFFYNKDFLENLVIKKDDFYYYIFSNSYFACSFEIENFEVLLVFLKTLWLFTSGKYKKLEKVIQSNNIPLKFLEILKNSLQSRITWGSHLQYYGSVPYLKGSTSLLNVINSRLEKSST